MIFSGSIHKENIMTISKTKNGTYRLKIYIPIEARMPLGIVNSNYYDKRFKTRKEARQAEIDLQKEIFFSQTSITISGGTLIKQDKPHLLLSHQAGQQLQIPKPVLKNIYYHFLETIRYSF